MAAGRKPYLILKDEKHKEGDVIVAWKFENGRNTGDTMLLHVCCVDTEDTSSAIIEGYCIVGVAAVKEQEGDAQ